MREGGKKPGVIEVRPKGLNSGDEEPRRFNFRRSVLLLLLDFSLGTAATFMQISATTTAAAELHKEETSTIPLAMIIGGAAVSALVVPICNCKFGNSKLMGLEHW